MEDRKLRTWQILFARAMEVIDSASSGPPDTWTFRGGTVLMLRHGHRFSKDIDIFLPDPQWLSYLTPRLNAKAEALTTDYVEQHGSLKLIFPEGEIDFVASESLSENPYIVERGLDRDVRVETSSEIIAKKVWHSAGSPRSASHHPRENGTPRLCASRSFRTAGSPQLHQKLRRVRDLG